MHEDHQVQWLLVIYTFFLLYIENTMILFVWEIDKYFDFADILKPENVKIKAKM